MRSNGTGHARRSIPRRTVDEDDERVSNEQAARDWSADIGHWSTDTAVSASVQSEVGFWVTYYQRLLRYGRTTKKHPFLWRVPRALKTELTVQQQHSEVFKTWLDKINEYELAMESNTNNAPSQLQLENKSSREEATVGARNDQTAAQAQRLLEQGFLVMTFTSADQKAAFEAASVKFNEYINSIPEMKDPRRVVESKVEDLGAGSFGALNYASAFHNEAAVYIDLTIASGFVGPVIAEVARQSNMSSWQLIPDRLVYRTKKQNPESYHTDNSAGAFDENDMFFGCFVNLNLEKKTIAQTAILRPGTHALQCKTTGGDFTKFTSTEQRQYREAEKEVGSIEIPPYSVLVLFENIVHRIAGRKPSVPIRRKFCGFRVTNDVHPWLNSVIEDAMDVQGPLVHKGGVVGRMFPRLWLTNHSQKLTNYARSLIPAMTTTHTFKSGKKKGTTISVPFVTPKSLARLQLPMYPMGEQARNRFQLHVLPQAATHPSTARSPSRQENTRDRSDER